jgi:hypothetical protein
LASFTQVVFQIEANLAGETLDGVALFAVELITGLASGCGVVCCYWAYTFVGVEQETWLALNFRATECISCQLISSFACETSG